MNPSAKSVSIIDVDEEKGTTTSAKLVGIVVAATSSTTPVPTPVNKTVIALKVRDAVIVAPSPKGASTHEPLLRYAHEKLPKIGAVRPGSDTAEVQQGDNLRADEAGGLRATLA
ncbi:MAG TPA: hypothetical protein VNA27_01405 [Rubrobacteraceae bacterium]|nr:hypothetical protein [Rubrobacteraceae bacterium]